jgi:hypothetical protein
MGILILSSLRIPPLVSVPCAELKVALTQGLGSGSEQVQTSKNRKFFLLDLGIKTMGHILYNNSGT